jgi:hypothetical protein
MPTTDIARTFEHYERLGLPSSFLSAPTATAGGFAIALRDGLELHFALQQHHDPVTTATWVYIGVEDADAMSDELDACGHATGSRATRHGLQGA